MLNTEINALANTHYVLQTLRRTQSITFLQRRAQRNRGREQDTRAENTTQRTIKLPSRAATTAESGNKGTNASTQLQDLH